MPACSRCYYIKVGLGQVNPELQPQDLEPSQRAFSYKGSLLNILPPLPPIFLFFRSMAKQSLARFTLESYTLYPGLAKF